MNSSNIQAIFDQLVDAIRAELREEFMSALSGEATPARRGRPPASKARKVGRPVKAAKAVQVSSNGRRSPEQLEETVKTIVAFVKKNPESRTEQIGEGLGIATKDLALPMKKLVAEKVLKTKGQRRGTTYTVKA